MLLMKQNQTELPTPDRGDCSCHHHAEPPLVYACRMLHAGGAAAGAAGASVAGIAPAGMAAAIGDAPFAKRQRMWNAFVMEEQRNNAVRYAYGSRRACRLHGGGCTCYL